jgi:hypothetical protein
VDETTTVTPPSDPTLNDSTNAIPTNSADAAQAITEALGDTIVPDRIRARDPVEEAPVVPAPATADTEVVQPAETTVSEPVSETVAPTTIEVPAEDPVVEEEPQEYIPPAQQVPQIDPAAFADENGYVDVNKLTAAINNAINNVQQTASVTAQRELAAQKNEERLWNSAIDKYPELKTDRTLRDFVQQARIGKTTEAFRGAGNDPQRLAQVKIPTPTQIASDLFKRIGQAKSEGVKSATETTTVAQTNVTPVSGSAAPTTSKREELFGKIRDPRDRIGAENAQRELLKDLLFNNQ